MLIRLITLSILLTSCLPGKFHMRTISKKKAVTEYEEKKFKLAFFDPAADKTFCPNVNVIFTSNTPEGASDYCFSDSNDPNQTCEWKSLPLDIKFKASSENQTLKKYLLFRNSEKVVLNETWESNELSIKPTTIAKTEADQVRQLKTDELTENQMDEYLCRMDEWSYNVAKNIAMNVSDSFTQERRVDMSHQLARMYYGDYGVPVKMSKDEISKVGWRLIVHTQEPAMTEGIRYLKRYMSTHRKWILPDSLIGFDVSYINFKKRDITNLNFKGTNLRGEQLNNIHPLSSSFSVSGLDLKGWIPNVNKNVEGVDFSYTKNQPWDMLNSITTLNKLNLSGLDLAEWKPTNTFTSSPYFKLSYSTNIPFHLIQKSSTLNYNSADFSHTDLSNWKPTPTNNIQYLDISFSSNIPWDEINNSTSGYTSMIFKGLDLSKWNPSSAVSIRGIDYQYAFNIPWSKLLLNSNLSGSNFEGQDLKDFIPDSSMTIAKINFKNAKNVNWNAINSNTGGTGHSNFDGLDLSQWEPSTTAATGVSIIGCKNVPWEKINLNTISHAGFEFSGHDLSKWSPSPTTSLYGINFENAKNIPWSKLNANTNIDGYKMVDFSYVDLQNWAPNLPVSLRGINLTGSKNIPWNILNNNTDVTAWLYANLSKIDLKNWNPSPSTSFQQTVFSENTNIPWNSINANTVGFYGTKFNKIDFSDYNPIVGVGQTYMLIFKSRNLPWNRIVNSLTNQLYYYLGQFSAFYLPYNVEEYLAAIDIEGFVPKHGYTITPPFGARSVQDFEEAAETSGYRGVKWGLDNSYPWGF